VFCRRKNSAISKKGQGEKNTGKILPQGKAEKNKGKSKPQARFCLYARL
jgi:hypothetical protein